jgi:hypothetical protein
MTEKQLIDKIQKLRKIKPNQDWVYFSKNQILGKTENRLSLSRLSLLTFIKEIQRGERFVFRHKPAFAFLTVLAIFIGLFGFTQNSVPGDSLFALKKIAEQSQAVFIAQQDQPKHNLEIANKRLDDLFKIAEENEIANLGPAINEYQETVSKAAESLAKLNDPNMEEIASAIKELEEKEEIVKSLGIEIGETEELNNVLAEIVGNEIDELESRELTIEQEELLIKIKQDYEQGNYSQALENILLFNQ